MLNVTPCLVLRRKSAVKGLLKNRHLRLRVLEALDRRAKQFRSREDTWPFRVPHEPLLLEPLVAATLGEEGGFVDPAALRSRLVLRMEWEDGDLWEAWVIMLPSGVTLYCDTGGGETRVLASARRGNAAEADRFFLERLGESRGHHFGIELSGTPPDRVRTSVDDRDLLADVFVELFEGTPGERAIHDALVQLGVGLPHAGTRGRDFRAEAARWLEAVLVAPPSASVRPGRRRPRRLRDTDDSAGR